jgi:hypothetical protein
LTQILLNCLANEERLVREAAESLKQLHEQLRSGKPPVAQESLVQSLANSSAERNRAATALAAEVGLPAKGLKLAALAERLAPSEAADLLVARDSLAAAASDLTAAHRRTANLAHYLRSYFQGVLAALTTADGPVRYGPSGARLSPASGVAIYTRG